MTRFKNILLIDDHASTNYYHQYILKEDNKADNIICADNVIDGALILQNLNDEVGNIEPSIVFLDINLPMYSGFELINRNIELVTKLLGRGVKIFMLSSSQNPSDLQLVTNNELIDGLYEKPLTLEIVNEIAASW